MESDDFRSATAQRRLRTWFWLVIVAILIGVVARVGQYASRRSFWHDEAFLILNLRAKTVAQLSGPLDAQPTQPQAAPPAFLWIEKGVLSVAGTSEYALRALSLALGILSLPIFARVAWRLAPGPGALWAVAALATCHSAIMHSAEVKPYSGDIFFTCLLLWAATEGEGDAFSFRAYVRAAAVAAIGFWCSYTVVFTYAAISLTFLLLNARRRTRWWAALVGINCGVGFSMAAVYFLFIHPQQHPLLYVDWAGAMLDWHRPMKIPKWLAKSTYDLVNYVVQNAGPVVMILAVVGTIGLWIERRWKWLGLLGIPALVALAAAGAHAYPFGGSRATVYLTPVFALLSGVGLWAMARAHEKGIEICGWVLGAVGAVTMLIQTGIYLARPDTRTHVRPAIEYVRAHRRPGDAVWVMGETTSVDYLMYETPDVRTTPEAGADTPIPPGRLWVIFGSAPGRLDGLMAPVMKRIQQQARLEDSFRVEGGAAVLFEREP
jgi:hypothetical protein